MLNWLSNYPEATDLKEFLWLFIWNLKLLYICWAAEVFEEPTVPF